MSIDKRCKCSMTISLLGDGCRYCQPQEYIDRLHEQIDDERKEADDGLMNNTRQCAKRYRWLREQDWFDSDLCVVRRPKNSVMPGSDCPSRTRLDEFVDQAIAAKEKA